MQAVREQRLAVLRRAEEGKRTGNWAVPVAPAGRPSCRAASLQVDQQDLSAAESNCGRITMLGVESPFALGRIPERNAPCDTAFHRLPCLPHAALNITTLLLRHPVKNN